MSDTIERLRAVRARLDAARAEMSAMDAEWRRLVWLPYPDPDKAVDSYLLPAAYAQGAAIESRKRAAVLCEEYMDLAMELAEEVCR